ncbi:MAG: helix-turn-helix domain-containing protein [Oscillospiraceae bacterium]
MLTIRLKELREGRGYSKRKVASDFNIAESTYGKWELGHRTPELDIIIELANYYGVSTDYLLGKTDDPAPPGEKKDPLGDLKFALWGDDEISDAALDDVRRYAEFIAQREREKRKGEPK